MKALVISLLLLTSSLFPSDDGCISKMDTGFMFIKSYSIKPSDKGFYETSYIFSKGTSYDIVTCCNEPISRLEIYSSSRQKLLDLSDGKLLSTPIQYPCSVTGIYYIRVYGSSGNLILGFKRTS